MQNLCHAARYIRMSSNPTGGFLIKFFPHSFFLFIFMCFFIIFCVLFVCFDFCVCFCCCIVLYCIFNITMKGPVSWYGKLTWESAQAWNLIILCTFVALGMTTIIMVHLIFYAIPLSIYDVIYDTKSEGTLL